MCHKCDQLAAIEAVLRSVGDFPILSRTKFSLVVAVGNHKFETKEDIDWRVNHIGQYLKAYGFMYRSYPSNLTNNQLMCILFNEHTPARDAGNSIH